MENKPNNSHIPTFELYMARVIVNNGHQNDTCYVEIGLLRSCESEDLESEI